MNLSRVLNPPKTGFNLETFNTILSETILEQQLKFKPPLKFFKVGLRGRKFCSIKQNLDLNF